MPKNLEQILRDPPMKYCGVQYSIDYPAWKKQIKRLLPEQKQGIKFHSGRQNSEIGAYSPKDNWKLGFNEAIHQILKNFMDGVE